MTARLPAVLGALVLAGCGAASTTGASASDAVPADAAAYVEISSDLGSTQWQRVQQLLNKFPRRPQLVEQLDDALRDEGVQYERDVKPALGDTVAFVWPRGDQIEEAVVLTQPDDKENWNALVQKAAGATEHVTGEVRGWQALATSRSALDALRSDSGSLADDDAFQAALGDLPDERLGLGWARGAALESLAGQAPRGAAPTQKLHWIAAALAAHDHGARLTLVASMAGPSAGDAYVSKRVQEAPGNAFVFGSFSAETLSKQSAQLAPLSGLLATDLAELLRGLRGEGAFWIRPGASLVEATAVVESASPLDAALALESITSGLPTEVQTGVVGGKVVATTAASLDRALRRSGPALGQRPDFRAAVEAAGLPEQTAGFLYVNVAELVPFLILAGAGGFKLPSELVQNLRPVRSVVAWARPDGHDKTRYEVYVEIR